MKTVIVPKCKYDDYFTELAKWRGYDYYKQGHIKNVHNENNQYDAIVQGTEDYEVTFKIEHGDIIDMHCTCPAFAKGMKCKHLYAVIFKEFGTEKEEQRPSYKETLYTKPADEKYEAEYEEYEQEESSEKTFTQEKRSLFDIASGVIGALNAFNDFFDVEKEDRERRNKELEEEMDLYDLDEEERELVRSGEWEPWQFDTDPDELDEESYYYEDDLR